MCLDRFLEDLEAEFEEILWRDNPERVRGERIRLLRLRATHAQQTLERCDYVVKTLDARMAALEQLRSDLDERVAIYLHVGDGKNAWAYALQLDCIRQELAGLRRQSSFQQQIRAREEGKLRDLHQEIDALWIGARPRAKT